MRRSFLLLLLLVTCGLTLAACGGDSGDDTGTTATSTATDGGAGGSGDIAIAMKDISFDPGSVTVKVGQKITWTNEDAVQHDVESTSGEKIDSELFGEGGTFSFTPAKAGTIEYVCTVHPGMDGTIVVEQ